MKRAGVVRLFRFSSLGLVSLILWPLLARPQLARADYAGLVRVAKGDVDTVDLCNNANGVFVTEPLSVCNVLAAFDNPVDRLLSVGLADITASNGLYFQHPFNNPPPPRHPVHSPPFFRI